MTSTVTKSILVLAMACMAICAGEPAAAILTADPAALARWQDMRFGMFIHWGPVSIKGTEIGWSRGAQVPADEYDNLYKQFNPTLFNADEWVKTAKDAGMKYIVLTTKHHDGFCLWDAKQTDYNIMNSPFKRDVVKELSAACKKEGIAFGAYYSICDWRHPDYPLGSPGGKTKKPNPDMARHYQLVKDQTRELIERYGPLITIWFDGEWEQPWTREYGNGLYQFLRGLQPDLVINNRVSKGRHGMEGTTADAHLNAGDYDTPEQTVGAFHMDRAWETCMTICQQWAWKPNDQMKSLQQCLQTLISTNGGNGNLLFNVGPMPDGRIEPRQVERLKEMGEWLKRNGEGIYGTRGGPFKPGPWGASTRKGNRIFVHIFKWDGDTCSLPAIPAKVTAAGILGGGAVDCKQTDDGITLTVPQANRDPIATAIGLQLDRPAMELAPANPTRGASLTSGAKATASNVYQKNQQFGADKAVDGDDNTRWATDAGTRSAWLEVDLGKPATFGRTLIDECDDYGKRIRKFELQYKDGEEWKTFLEGTEVGKGYSKEFAPVTARFVRLNIPDATDGPTIREFQLFAPKK
jgi:alpha-L-fucosidase